MPRHILTVSFSLAAEFPEHAAKAVPIIEELLTHGGYDPKLETYMLTLGNDYPEDELQAYDPSQN